MTLGLLTTNKTWSQLRREVEAELRRWGITEYRIPYKDDAERRGQVTIEVVMEGHILPLTCGRFAEYRDAPERNLCALREVIRSLRLADQRGIGLVMAQAARDLLALPEPVTADDPHVVLAIRPEMPERVKRATYRELVKLYHPDNPDTGDREKWEKVRQAGWELGL
jgi:hypothetical protein